MSFQRHCVFINGFNSNQNHGSFPSRALATMIMMTMMMIELLSLKPTRNSLCCQRGEGGQIAPFQVEATENPRVDPGDARVASPIPRCSTMQLPAPAPAAAAGAAEPAPAGTALRRPAGGSIQRQGSAEAVRTHPTAKKSQGVEEPSQSAHRTHFHDISTAV